MRFQLSNVVFKIVVGSDYGYDLGVGSTNKQIINNNNQVKTVKL